MTILGIGLDLVTISDFAEQLERAGTTMLRESFTAGERRYCQSKGTDPARSFAARWAAKEAVLKAWATSRFARRPQIGDNPYPLIEVVNDAWGRPSIKLHGLAAEFLRAALSTPAAGQTEIRSRRAVCDAPRRRQRGLEPGRVRPRLANPWRRHGRPRRAWRT